jgi:hypothetical protein
VTISLAINSSNIAARRRDKQYPAGRAGVNRKGYVFAGFFHVSGGSGAFSLP